MVVFPELALPATRTRGTRALRSERAGWAAKRAGGAAAAVAAAPEPGSRRTAAVRGPGFRGVPTVRGVPNVRARPGGRVTVRSERHARRLGAPQAQQVAPEPDLERVRPAGRGGPSRSASRAGAPSPSGAARRAAGRRRGGRRRSPRSAARRVCGGPWCTWMLRYRRLARRRAVVVRPNLKLRTSVYSTRSPRVCHEDGARLQEEAVAQRGRRRRSGRCARR